MLALTGVLEERYAFQTAAPCIEKIIVLVYNDTLASKPDARYRHSRAYGDCRHIFALIHSPQRCCAFL